MTATPKAPIRNDANVAAKGSAGTPKVSRQKVGDVTSANPANARKKQVATDIAAPTMEAQRAQQRLDNPLGVRKPKIFHSAPVGAGNPMSITATATQQVQRAQEPAVTADAMTRSALIAMAKKQGVDPAEIDGAIEAGKLKPINAAGDRMSFNRGEAEAYVKQLAGGPFVPDE